MACFTEYHHGDGSNSHTVICMYNEKTKDSYHQKGFFTKVEHGFILLYSEQLCWLTRNMNKREYTHVVAL